MVQGGRRGSATEIHLAHLWAKRLVLLSDQGPTGCPLCHLMRAGPSGVPSGHLRTLGEEAGVVSNLFPVSHLGR